MSLISPRIQYTQRSFEDLRQQLINIVQTTDGISSKWTDFNESDLGLVLLELWCAIGDELNFYLDNQANEAFFETARQRKSVVSLAKLIAYNLDPVVSSAGIIIMRLPTENPHTLPITIPKYTRFSSAGSVTLPFVSTSTVTLPAGSLAIEVGVVQGVLFEEEFLSDNTINQTYALGRSDIASNFDTIEVFVGVGDDINTYDQWDQAANFIIASAADSQTRFVVETDHNDNTIIKFGDGKFGAIPPDNFSIVVRYLASAGEEGNLGAGKVSIVSDVIKDSSGFPINLVITNEEACVGGTDRETIEHAKFQAPQELSALNRAVTRFDGAALIGGIAGISIANVWGEHELAHPNIKHFNQMYTTMIAEGITPVSGKPSSWLPTTSLKNLVTDYIEAKKIITTRVVFKDPNCIFVDLQLDVYVSESASPLTVKQAVLNTLNDFFDVGTAIFGEDLRYSNLVKALDELPSVAYVSLKTKRNGLYPGKGMHTGGTSVTISGAGFQVGATVKFDTNSATSVVVVDSKTITCITPVAPLVLVGTVWVSAIGFVDVIVTNPDLTEYKILDAFYYHDVLTACEREDLGEEQTVDSTQFIYNEQDIIIRNNEIHQLGIIEASDGSETYVHFAQDSVPMTAKLVYTPLYALLNQTAVFDAQSSSSPYGSIVTYQWDMGAAGQIMKKDTSGSYVYDSPSQPQDNRTIITSLSNLRSVVYWRYTTKPSSGIATVVLTVFDSLGNCRATAIPYEIRQV